MFSTVFIQRPVLANVIAVVTMLIGGVALWKLPIEQYPSITPPTVRVTTTYPGASAQIVSNTIAAPIEQQVNGVEGMMYMQSTCSSDGSYTLTVTFEIGTNLDMAQVMVQNRVAIAEAQLPEDVKRQGVTVKKQSTAFILVVSLASPDGRYDTLFLSNYATLRLRDELSRVPGVGDVTVFGNGNYSMRIWLEPNRLKARNLLAQDVVDALREQNVQVAAGQVGQPPVKDDVPFQYTVTALGRLTDPQQFENIVVKTGGDRRVTYLKDVGRVELGGQSYDQFTEMKGKANANIGIFQLPGANALDVAAQVKKVMAELALNFPEGMEYSYPLDTTKFVDAAVFEVYKTLFEAGLLVLVVIMLFLQDWRAVLIPATTVPVTIVGAFAALAALGFSINMLTLFGLVLAIGIVVDDAIVIVENAVHHIEKGEAPKEATIRAMSEVLGPIMGITLVLTAVFVPAAMLAGLTGQLYRQFALTIAATAVISAINAVTLKPAQCALWLRPVSGKKNAFFRGFNFLYGYVERAYTAVVGWLVRIPAFAMVVYVGLVVGAGFWYTRLPTGFFPLDDQGYVFMMVQLPDAASQQRTRDVMHKVDAILAKTPGVADWISIGGLSLIDNSSASNAGTVFITFDDWSKRRDPSLSLPAILGNLSAQVSQIEEAMIFAFPPPAIRGLGVRAGFELMVEDRGGAGLEALQQAAVGIMEDAKGQSALLGVNTTFRPGVPQITADIDRVKVKAMEVPLGNVFGTLQTYLGSAYVNDFNKFDRTYQVRVQADQRYRSTIPDVERLEVRNRKGEMIPMGSLAKVRRSFGPQIINRYNLYPAATVNGGTAVGFSSGEGLRIMEQIARAKLPSTMGFEWTGMAFQEKRVGGETIVVFSMAVLLVYLCLAGQYESWILPFAVILVVPLGLLGSIGATSIRGMDNNIYTQIGIVLIIALASKNAILIVEFARENRLLRGRSIREAAVEAAKMRFRPILMTSLAFILGVAPLVWAHGAGASGQQALGTAVFGGMLASTFLAVFFVPVFFVVFQAVDEWLRPKRVEESMAAVAAASPPDAH